MKYSQSMNRIYNNLMAGAVYGYVSTWRADYPDKALAGKERFQTALYKHACKPLFCWQHYGSSANRATKSDLAFILHKLFNMSAPQFEKRFITREEFKRRFGRDY